MMSAKSFFVEGWDDGDEVLRELFVAGGCISLHNRCSWQSKAQKQKILVKTGRTPSLHNSGKLPSLKQNVFSNDLRFYFCVLGQKFWIGIDKLFLGFVFVFLSGFVFVVWGAVMHVNVARKNRASFLHILSSE